MNRVSSPLPSSRSRIEAIFSSQRARDLAVDHIRKRGLTHLRESAFVEGAALDVIGSNLGVTAVAGDLGMRPITEAIILLTTRPALLVTDGKIEVSNFKEIETQLKPVRNKLVKPIGSVGRVELSDHDSYEWCGTAWRIEDDLLVTNRHVARIFAEKQGSTFRFRANAAGKQVSARVDFREEYRVNESAEFGVAEVLWIADDNSDSPDMAVLRVKKARNLPAPLQAAESDPSPGQWIAVVGYPARDGKRNDPTQMSEIFKDIYDVKRCSPGKIDTAPKDSWFVTHEATTLGGNSGSPLLDLATQKLVGLHFGGKFRETNYAVKVSAIKAVVKRRAWVNGLRETLHVPPEAFSEKARTLGSMTGRLGYDEKFLGESVAVPKPGKQHQVLGNKFKGKLLPYMHFSILMSKSRRLPIFTAENIDGAKKIKLKRKDAWGFDPRIPKTAQVGHKEFYGPQPFDKGHMVRRENAGWGDTHEEALLGENDTFVYTNAVPQMPNLNQKTWLSLENYVLESSRTHGFKVSVFTGPAFRERDTAYGDVLVPERFWKVVVALDADTQELLSSSYMLSQEGFMPEEGFRFGPFKTFQVPITAVEEAGGIRFDAIVRGADVFSPSETESMVDAQRFVEVNEAADIVLTRKRS